MYSLTKALAVLVVLSMAGYAYMGALYPHWRDRLRIGASLVVGELLFVGLFALAPNADLMPMLVAVLSTGAVAYGAGVVLRRHTHAVASPGRSVDGVDLSDMALIGACLAVLTPVALLTDYWDIHLHATYAEQILRGSPSPAPGGMTGVPMPYHFGFDILLAYVVGAASLPMPVAFDLLVLAAIPGIVLLTSAVSRHLGGGRKAEIWRAVLVLGGGGLSFLLHWYDSSKELQFPSMVFQAPWVFAYPAFLMLVAMVCRTPLAQATPAGGFVLATWGLPLSFALPLGNSPLVVVVPFMAAALALHSTLFSNNKRREALTIVIGIAGVVAGFALNRQLGRGGAFLRGDAYARPETVLSLVHLFDGDMLVALRDYTAKAVFHLAMVVGLLWWLAAQAKSCAEWLADRAVFLLAALLALVATPFAVYMLDIPRWDNFCKFPVFGAVAGWFLYDRIVMRYSSRSRLLTGVARVMPLAASLHFLIYTGCDIATRPRIWADWRDPNPALTRAVVTSTAPQERFLVVGRNPTTMKKYLLVQCFSGASIVNSYFDIYLYSRNREAVYRRATRDAQVASRDSIGALIARGGSEPDILLCSVADMGMMTDLLRQQQVLELSRSEKEGWVLYRVRRH